MYFPILLHVLWDSVHNFIGKSQRSRTTIMSNEIINGDHASTVWKKDEFWWNGMPLLSLEDLISNFRPKNSILILGSYRKFLKVSFFCSLFSNVGLLNIFFSFFLKTREIWKFRQGFNGDGLDQYDVCFLFHLFYTETLLWIVYQCVSFSLDFVFKFRAVVRFWRLAYVNFMWVVCNLKKKKLLMASY